MTAKSEVGQRAVELTRNAQLVELIHLAPCSTRNYKAGLFLGCAGVS